MAKILWRRTFDQNGDEHVITDENALPRSEQAVLGAKNFLPPATGFEPAGSSGLTFVDNKNGTYTIKAGTASGSGGQWLFATRTKLSSFGMPVGNYKVTCEGIVSGISFALRNRTVEGTTSVTVNNPEPTLSYADASHEYDIYFWVDSGTVISSDIVVKPMISFDGGEFVPYAMTNKELTDAVVPVDITSAFMTLEEGVSLGSDGSVEKIGNLIVGNLVFKKTGNFPQGQAITIATVDSKYRPKKNLNSVCHFTTSEWDSSQPISGYFWIGTNGSIIIRQYLETAQTACKVSFSYVIS